jgi:hypothetical protein
MKINYPHNVIRIRKGKRVKEQTYWIVAVLNKRKSNSLYYIKIGYIKFGNKGTIAINYKKLASFVNKGFILKKSVKQFIALAINY